MANGRLAKCTINPYSSSLVYENTSGSAASITLSAQVLDDNTNSEISVAIEDTTRTMCGTTTVDTICAPVNCLASIVTCNTGSYQGVYVGNAGCFHPMYVDCDNTIYCTPYRYNAFGCCWPTSIVVTSFCYCVASNTITCCCTVSCCAVIPFPLTNTTIVPNRNAYENPIYLDGERGSSCVSMVSFDCCGVANYYYRNCLTTIESLSSNFVNPTATPLTYCSTCWCVGTQTLSTCNCCAKRSFISAAVDYWSDGMNIIGISEEETVCNTRAKFTYSINLRCGAYLCAECCAVTYGFNCISCTCTCNGIQESSIGICSVCQCAGCSVANGQCPSQIRVYLGNSGAISNCSCAFCVACVTYNLTCPFTPPFGLQTDILACAVNCYKIRNTLIYDLYTSNKGPTYLTGCNLMVVKNPDSDSKYHFRAAAAGCNQSYCLYIACVGASGSNLILNTFESGSADIGNCTNTQIYPIKWLSYNPVSECNYFMNFGSSKDKRGIYSINWDKICCTNNVANSCDGYCYSVCLDLGTSGFNIFFTKVADLPSPLVNCDPTTLCPTPIFRTGKSAWRFSVNDGGTWKEYCSDDMVNWNPRTTFYNTEFYPSTTYTTTGTSIVKNCDCYFSVIDSSTYTDYKVSINNYERTGLVVSNGDKIYVNNPSGYELSVNVWGYEG